MTKKKFDPAQYEEEYKKEVRKLDDDKVLNLFAVNNRNLEKYRNRTSQAHFQKIALNINILDEEILERMKNDQR